MNASIPGRSTLRRSWRFTVDSIVTFGEWDPKRQRGWRLTGFYAVALYVATMALAPAPTWLEATTAVVSFMFIGLTAELIARDDRGDGDR